MIDDLQFMISRRTESARNFDGGVSPRRFQFNMPWHGTAIRPAFKSSILNHHS
jgi:hypothetical protein